MDLALWEFHFAASLFYNYLLILINFILYKLLILYFIFNFKFL